MLAWAPPPAIAQWSGPARLQVGDSVRVRLPGALRLDAALRELRGDTLMLAVQGVEDAWPVSGYDLVLLERFGPRTPREGFRNGLMLGMASGLFLGAAVGLALNASGTDDSPEPGVELMRQALRGAGLGAALGGVVGGFVGGARPGSGWVALPLPTR